MFLNYNDASNFSEMIATVLPTASYPKPNPSAQALRSRSDAVVAAVEGADQRVWQSAVATAEFSFRAVHSVSVAYSTNTVRIHRPICGGPRSCLGLEGLRAVVSGFDDQRVHF
jgi:hypothetical protein